MKNFKRILALVLAVMMVAACMVSTQAADTASVEYNDKAVERLNKLGIFKGTTSGDMKADDDVTREQMALFTSRVFTGKTDKSYWEAYLNDTTFEDIDTTAAESIGAITYAYEQGIVIGKSDVRFDPKGNVSYQDALTMVVRSLGYTGLSYPNGFINKAMKLGLTNGISGLAYADNAPRGVVATILYNALYAEDSLFAENFNLSSGNYMLVATPTHYAGTAKYEIPGASITGYTGKKLNEGYVAFAEIGDDYRAINNNYVYAKTTQIADDIEGNFADKLGYAYQLTFENDVLTWGDVCATKTFVNYGDEREIGSKWIKYNHLYNGSTVTFDDDTFLTFGGESYNLVDRFDKDYTAPTGTHNLILYSDFGAPVHIEQYDYLFDANGNIVDPNGNILLVYRAGEYYYEENGISVKATSDMINAAISELVANFGYYYGSDYAMVEQGNVISGAAHIGTDKVYATRDIVLSITRNYFCELTAMDYDNDGIYDAAIYTPYYYGYVGNVGTNFALTGAVDFDGNQVLNNVKAANYDVTGKVSKLSSWGFYLYTFNRHTNVIDVKEVGKSVSGKVEWAVKGKPSNGIYEDAQVKIGGTTYDVGGWAIDNLLGLYTVRGFDKSHWTTAYNTAKNAGLVTYADYTDWDGSVKEGFSAWYYNGWNDVLEVGMTKYFAGFKGTSLAGHLVHGVPTPAASASYNFVTFNPYQSEFAVENDQIVVDAIVDASGKYKTIKINSVEGEEFTDVEFAIFCEYIDVFYGANANNIKYSYFFNAERKAVHQATPLYKNIERAFIIDLLGATVDAAGKWDAAGTTVATTNVYGVLGTNDDGSYQLSVLTSPTTIATDAIDGTVTFTLGVSSAPVVSGGKVFSVDKDTIWTFVAKDGIYTYTGVPAATDSLVLSSTAKFHTVNSDNVLLFDLENCIEDICVGTADWTEVVQDIDLAYVPLNHTHTEELLAVEDNTTEVCEYIAREHIDTWALNEYVPFVRSTFMADEVYMVTDKTANTKIYNEDGVMIYVYSNLYNLIANKYEESVIFTGDEAQVFLFNGQNGVWYEDATGEITTNYGAIITRDDIDGVQLFTPAETKANLNAAGKALFNVTATAEGLKTGVYASKTNDNNNKLAVVTIDGTPYVVRTANFVVVTNMTNKNVAVGDFSKIAANATVYFTYDAVTGTMTGYAFN